MNAVWNILCGMKDEKKQSKKNLEISIGHISINPELALALAW